MEYDIVETICVISERDGWIKELNVVSWNGRPPKFDLREWNSDHSRMTKGITLTTDEASKLYSAFHDIINEWGEK